MRYLKDGAFTVLKRDTAVYVNNRCTKEVFFLSKIVYKRVRVGPRGGAFPFKILLSTPPQARLLSIMLMIEIVTKVT